jgi:hypothetical protein
MRQRPIAVGSVLGFNLFSRNKCNSVQTYERTRAIALVEDESVPLTSARTGMLAQALNLRVAIAWATEARAEVMEGAQWSAALARAAEDTVIPYCCARDGQGATEAGPAQDLRDVIRRRTLRL